MVTLTDIERESYKNSPIHKLDPRVKLLFTLAIIIYVVSLPRIEEKNMIRLLAIEAYLVLLVLAAGLDLRYFFLRILAILPFGLGIALIQPFLRPSFIKSYTPYPLDLPLGLSITYEGLSLRDYIACEIPGLHNSRNPFLFHHTHERYGRSSRQDWYSKGIYSAPEHDGTLSFPVLVSPETNKDCTANPSFRYMEQESAQKMGSQTDRAQYKCNFCALL